MMLVIGTCDGDVDVVPPIHSQLEDALSPLQQLLQYERV